MPRLKSSGRGPELSRQAHQWVARVQSGVSALPQGPLNPGEQCRRFAGTMSSIRWLLPGMTDEHERHTVRSSVIAAITVVSLAMLGTACTYYPSFGFPVEDGSIEAGRQAFVDNQCHRCHSVAGVIFPAFPGASSPLLELGGVTSQVKAYSELVTSVINPDHRISERYRERLPQPTSRQLQSPMTTTHIETMTVRQLIDLVAFLDSRYELVDDYRDDFSPYLEDEE
jgi:hypothetical protein